MSDVGTTRNETRRKPEASGAFSVVTAGPQGAGTFARLAADVSA